MKENKIGFATEVTFGETPVNGEPITLLPIQSKRVMSEAKKVLIVEARFDCPCCGKGIQINIDTEI